MGRQSPADMEINERETQRQPGPQAREKAALPPSYERETAHGGRGQPPRRRGGGRGQVLTEPQRPGALAGVLTAPHSLPLGPGPPLSQAPQEAGPGRGEEVPGAERHGPRGTGERAWARPVLHLDSGRLRTRDPCPSQEVSCPGLQKPRPLPVQAWGETRHE